MTRTGILPTDTAILNAQEIDTLRFPEKLIQIPRRQWPNKDRAEQIGLVEVWRSRGFLVQIFRKKDTPERLSVCRTKVDQSTGRWVEGITWDELQDLKKQCGRGEAFAVEVYPEDSHLINVANMRHLWILPAPLPFAWRNK